MIDYLAALRSPSVPSVTQGGCEGGPAGLSEVFEKREREIRSCLDLPKVGPSADPTPDPPGLTEGTEVRRECCASCGRTPAVLVEMEPGHDGEPWWLCGPCWAPPARAVRPVRPATRQRKQLGLDDVEGDNEHAVMRGRKGNL